MSELRLLLLLLVLPTAAAQTLTVTNAPFAPGDKGFRADAQVTHAFAAFRFSASGGDVTLNGLTLPALGNCDWTAELDPAAGVQLALDDGDEVYDSALDTALFSGGGSAPEVVAPFSVPVTIASGSFADVWVILTIAPSTTRQQPDQFETRVSDVAAVDCDAPTVAIGSPVPKSGRVSSIVFSITSVTPDSLSQFSDITITGEGFTPPVRVYLNGMLVTDPVAGAEVNAAHTEIINIPVPHIDGAEENGVVVEVETALIEPQDAGVLLSYRFVEWPGGCAGDCCAAQMRTFGGRAGVVLLLVTIMVIASRRRRSSRGHRP